MYPPLPLVCPVIVVHFELAGPFATKGETLQPKAGPPPASQRSGRDAIHPRGCSIGPGRVVIGERAAACESRPSSVVRRCWPIAGAPPASLAASLSRRHSCLVPGQKLRRLLSLVLMLRRAFSFAVLRLVPLLLLSLAWMVMAGVKRQAQARARLPTTNPSSKYLPGKCGPNSSLPHACSDASIDW